MAASAPNISSVSYPANTSGFLSLTVYPSTTATQISTVTISVGGAAESSAFASGALGASFQLGGSTVSGSGTSASPYVFSLRPNGGWSSTSDIRLFITETASGEPSGFGDYYDLRQFQNYTDDLLTNLAANPSERTGAYASVAIQCLVQDTDAGSLSGLATSITLANALSPVMPIYPGIRVMPSMTTIASWMDESYWETMATKIETVLGYRQSGDPRIALDIEGYGGTAAEPTVSTLTAAGYTIEQFNAAIQPVMDVLLAANPRPVVCSYPNVSGSVADRHAFQVRLLDVLGPSYCQLFWETTFNASEYYRKTSLTTWPQTMEAAWKKVAEFESNYGVTGLKHRFVVDDDILRDWGAQTRDTAASFGPLKPWIFDLTRADRTSYGTSASRVGTSVSSVNDIQYGWSATPTSTTAPDSFGSETSISLPVYRSTAQSSSASGAGLVADAAGLRLRPQGSDIYAAFRVSAMPTSSSPNGATEWTTDRTFQIPSSLAASAPLCGQADTNFGYHQVWFDYSTNAIKWAFSNGASQTILSSPSRDTDIRLQLSRNGNDSWAYCVNGGSVQTFTVGATIGSSASIWIEGGGQDPAFFPSNNKIASCIGYLLKNQLLIWWRALDTSTEYTRINSGQYPIGRGT